MDEVTYGECRLCRMVWNVDQLWVYNTPSGSARFICNTCQTIIMNARRFGTYVKDKKLARELPR